MLALFVTLPANSMRLTLKAALKNAKHQGVLTLLQVVKNLHS
jgi:hypothetical protein